MTIASKIESAKKQIIAKKNELAKLADAAANGEDVAASTLETLTKSIKEDQAKVASLEKAEQVLVSKSAPAFIRNKAANEYSFEKSALVMLKAKADSISPVQAAIELYGEDSGTVAVTKSLTTKAVVDAARTDTATWAQELIRPAYGEFLDLLRPMAILPQLAAKGGINLTFGGDNQVIVPFYNGTANNLAGAFIGEGQTIPVKKTAFGSKTIKSNKLGVITVCTSEILSRSVPSIEPILRDAILQDTAAVLDSIALGTGAATATTPAGLLNGVTAVAAAGVTAADVITALKTAINAMNAANLGRTPVAVMRPNVKLGLSLMMNATGQFIFANELANNRLLGIDIVTSQAAPAGEIIIVDVAEVYFGLGSPSFAVSDTAALQMNDSPATGPDLSKQGTKEVASMFQNDMYAIRMISHVGWADVRGGGVQVINGLGSI